MARTPARESAEDRAIREVDSEDSAALKRLAFEAGPPSDSEQLSAADEDAIWAINDPAVDGEQFPTLLMTDGLPPEMLQSLRVLQIHPEWAELYGQPTQDAELADQLTRLAEYPWRWSLLVAIPDPEEQVRKAETLDRRFQRKHADMQGAPATATPAEMPMPDDDMQPIDGATGGAMTEQPMMQPPAPSGPVAAPEPMMMPAMGG